MLSHQVTCQGYRLRHLLVLPAGNQSLQSLHLCGALPHDPPPVRPLRLIPRRLAGAVDHADCLPNISLQAHPIKQANQGVECTLDPVGVRQGNLSILRIE